MFFTFSDSFDPWGSREEIEIEEITKLVENAENGISICESKQGSGVSGTTTTEGCSGMQQIRKEPSREIGGRNDDAQYGGKQAS